MNPKKTNASCRKPPAEPRSMVGNSACMISSVSGEMFARESPRARAAAAMTKAYSPIPTPQARASGSRSPSDRLVGPPRPSVASGNDGHGMRLVDAEVAPGEGLDADGEQDDGDDRTRDERCPVELADERLVVHGPAEPGHVREARERGDRGLIAVEEVATEQ